MSGFLSGSRRNTKLWWVFAGGVVAAVLPLSAGGAESLVDAPKVRITKVEFRRADDCRWSWVAELKSSDAQRVGAKVFGTALPPEQDAGHAGALLDPGSVASLAVPAYVFAWPKSVRELRVKLDAKYQPGTEVAGVDTQSAPIVLPPIPVAELRPPALTARPDGSATATVAVGIAGSAPATLHLSEIRVAICHSSSEPHTWTCPTTRVSGALASAGCKGGGHFASARAEVPGATVAVKVTVALSGTGKVIGERVFPVTVPNG